MAAVRGSTPHHAPSMEKASTSPSAKLILGKQWKMQVLWCTVLLFLCLSWSVRIINTAVDFLIHMLDWSWLNLEQWHYGYGLIINKLNSSCLSNIHHPPPRPWCFVPAEVPKPVAKEGLPRAHCRSPHMGLPLHVSQQPSFPCPGKGPSQSLWEVHLGLHGPRG